MNEMWVLGVQSVRAAGIAMLLCMGVVTPALADDSVVSCASPPKKAASVAVHRGNQVSFTQDTQDNTCTFSVNGAVAKSPPPHLVLGAVNLFRNRALLFQKDPKETARAVAALLAAAAPVDDVPGDLTSILDGAVTKLMSCLNDFFESDGRRQPSIFTNMPGGDFDCQGISPYTNENMKHGMLDKTGIAVGSPTLMIKVVWRGGRFTSVTFLPINMRGLPDIFP